MACVDASLEAFAKADASGFIGGPLNIGFARLIGVKFLSSLI